MPLEKDKSKFKKDIKEQKVPIICRKVWGFTLSDIMRGAGFIILIAGVFAAIYQNAETLRLQELNREAGDNRTNNAVENITNVLLDVNQSITEQAELQASNQAYEETKDQEELKLVREGLNATNQLLSQSVNISQEERTNATKAILTVFNDVIPTINSTLTQQNITGQELVNNTIKMVELSEEMFNFTRFISESFDEKYLAKEERQYGQSNRTDLAIPDIQDKLNLIINQTGNNSKS
jgi:hypothetical protein